MATDDSMILGDLHRLRVLTSERPLVAKDKQRTHEFCATCFCWESDDGQEGECSNGWAMRWARRENDATHWHEGCMNWEARH